MSFDPHGSNIAELFCATRGGFEAAGFALGADGADRLNAELMLSIGGDETLLGGGAAGTGAGGEAGEGVAKASKSPNRSFDGDFAGAIDFGAGGGDCVKAKSRPFDGAGAGTGGGFGCVEAPDGALSKKLPPLNGGGDVTFGADGEDLAGMLGAKLLNSEKADCCFG